MRLLLSEPTELIDGSQPNVPGTPIAARPVRLDKGEYDAEEIPNPAGFADPWIVIVGTRTGATRAYLEKKATVVIQP
jgi:hypothetical protein